MRKTLRVLNVEDSEDDAFLLRCALEKGGYELEFERVETADAMRSALYKKHWDLIISDYRLPMFSGPAALALLKETSMDLPFIIVSGAIGEETAVAAMKAGAHDYIMKGHLQRLIPAIERELQEAIVREERRKAQEELKANKTQLSNALEIAHLGHWEYDIPSDIFLFNEQFYKLFRTTVEKIGGYIMSSAEYIGRLVYPEDAAIVRREIQKAIQTTDPEYSQQVEHRILYIDGTVGYITMRLFIVKDAQCKTIKITGVNQDITERKKAEMALRKSEEKYHSLFDSSIDAILLTQIDGSILDANPSACTLFGRTLEEIKKIRNVDLVDTTNPLFHSTFEKNELLNAETTEITMIRADREKFQAEVASTVFVDASGLRKTSMIIRDLTERRRAEQNYQRLFHEMLDGFAVHEIICGADGKPRDYRFLAVNPAFERMTGLIAENIIGKTVLDVLPGTEQSWIDTYGHVALTGEPAFFENYSKNLDKFFEVTAFQPMPNHFACIFVDTTERKRTERALRESEKKYRLITETIADVVWTSDLDFKITYISPSVEKMFGEPADAYKKRAMEERFPPKSLKLLKMFFSEELEKEKDPAIDKDRSRLIEVKSFRADGTTFWVSMNVSFIRDENGTIAGLHGVSCDISDRKRNEEEILHNEARLEGLLRIAQYKASSIQDLLDYALEEAIKLTDSQLGYIYFYNDQSKEFTLNTWSKEVMKECSVRNAPTIYQLEKTGIWGEAVRQAKPIIVNDFQSPHPLKKGYPEGHARLYKYLTVPIFSADRIVAVAGVANKSDDYINTDVRQLTLLMDSVWRILEAKRLTEELLMTEGRYRSIFDNAQEGIFQTNKEGKFLTVNNAMATMLGYDSPKDLMSVIIDVAHQVFVNPEDQRHLLKDIDDRNSVTGYVCQHYRKDKSIIWVSIDQHAVYDNGGNTLYYEGFCEDITERRMNTERMRKALGATVYAISAAVEARDPYTAGHQRRVANLAQAIAAEIGLSADQIEGIRLAASIHDLGKLSVPAEILTKPKKLLETEFDLIKIHPQAGYDILKDIEFQWPIARMVLEHHERMNGSGYPNNLIGDQILMESRILAVADVVESMASYRPYRPALGIDAALEEIEKNRDILYDREVVENCVKLFRNKNFILV